MSPRSRAETLAFLLVGLLTSMSIFPARDARASDPWTGHAVIAGVADYEEVSDLFFSNRDAEDLRETLLLDAEHWADSNVEIILDSDATADAILAAIDGMKAATASTDDVCLFFFSGHGSTTDDLDGDETAPGDHDDEVLLAYDARISGSRIVSGGILDDQLATQLSGFTTQRVCVIVDSCHAGGMAKSPGGVSAADWVAGMAEDIARIRPAAITKSPVPGTKDVDDLAGVDLVALMACEDVQESEEDFILQNGVFTFYVLQAMCLAATDTNGDTLVSAEEIFAFAAPETVKWNPKQTPFLFDGDPDEGHQLPVMTAGDRYVERIVTEDDLPFGGGIKGGCLPVRAPVRSAPWCDLRAPVRSAPWCDLRAPVRSAPRCDLRASRTQSGAPCNPDARPDAPPALLAALVAVLGAICLRRRAFATFALFLIVFCVGGCLYPYPPARHAYTPPTPAAEEADADASGAGAPSVLPGAKATGEEAEAGRFVGRVLHVGVRAGALVPFGSRNTQYWQTVQAGLFVAGSLGEVPFEIGVDACRLESRGVDVTADVLSGRVDVLVPGGPTPGGHERYGHFGPRIMVDFADVYWGATSEVAAAVGAGVGLRSPDAGWDARFSVDALLGSSNIAGFLSAGAAFRF